MKTGLKCPWYAWVCLAVTGGVISLRADDNAYVYFLETRGRGVFLRAAPIDVSATIRDLLLDRMDATVLTSATLTVDGAFDYVKGRLGVGRAIELKLDSEFDYARQSILYLPLGIPDPRQPSFAAAAAREVVSILKLTSGRAFVLFTSYANLREVHRLAADELEYPILVQGTAPRSALLAPLPMVALRAPLAMRAARGSRAGSCSLRWRRASALSVAARPSPAPCRTPARRPSWRSPARSPAPGSSPRTARPRASGAGSAPARWPPRPSTRRARP